MVRSEAVAGRQEIERTVERRLEIVVEGHVGHLPARRTDQVVVMRCQVLGQLEVAELVAGDDAVDHAGGDELGQVPVRGGLGQRPVAPEDLRDRQRTVGRRQHMDQGSSRSRVTQPGVMKSLRRGRVQLVDVDVVGGGAPCHVTRVPPLVGTTENDSDWN